MHTHAHTCACCRECMNEDHVCVIVSIANNGGEDFVIDVRDLIKNTWHGLIEVSSERKRRVKHNAGSVHTRGKTGRLRALYHLHFPQHLHHPATPIT